MALVIFAVFFQFSIGDAAEGGKLESGVDVDQAFNSLLEMQKAREICAKLN